MQYYLISYREGLGTSLSGFVRFSIHFFVNFFMFLNACISVKTGPINTKLGDFVNLGMLFLTM